MEDLRQQTEPNQSNHTRCRICNSRLPAPFLSLGSQPLANNLSPAPDTPVPYYPLALTQCSSCSLVQLTHVVPPEELFSTYLYTPSQSKTFVTHFTNMARTLQDLYGIRNGELVVDIGSNDGLLLSKFRRGIRTIGVEPAKNIDSPVHTVRKFWSKETAKYIRDLYGFARLTTATNVFAHVDDIHGFLEGVGILLQEDGALVIEVPGLLEMLRAGTYDLVYHEHLSYFSLSPLIDLFEAHDFHLVGIETVPIHGGSMRLFVKRRDSGVVSSTVGKRIGQESRITQDILSQFVSGVERSRQSLLSILRDDPKHTAGFTAPAKATTLIHYCGLTNADVKYICDDNPMKIGNYIPGTGIFVADPVALSNDHDLERVVVFAWNLEKELVPRLKGLCREVVIPMPEVRVIPLPM